MTMATLDQPTMQQLTDQFQRLVDDFFAVQCRYEAAIRQVKAKLENLDAEFRMRHRRNPIHHMQTRLKTLPSIVEKLQRKQIPLDMNAATTNLTDIAGVRVVCSYLDDIYTVARLLLQQDDVKLVRTRDYIREPKPNGYRSLHLIIQVPVYLSVGKLMVPVEVQIRTIAMDFWATLEHQLRYKAIPEIPASISDELVQTATDIAHLDQRMQCIHDQVDLLERDINRERAAEASPIGSIPNLSQHDETNA